MHMSKCVRRALTLRVVTLAAEHSVAAARGSKENAVVE